MDSELELSSLTVPARRWLPQSACSGERVTGNLSLVKLISDPANLTPGDTSVASFGNCLILGSTNGKKLISYKLPAITHVSTLPLGDPWGHTIIDMKITKVGEKRYAAATLINLILLNLKSDCSDANQLQYLRAGDSNDNRYGRGGGAGILGGSAGLGFSPDGRKMYVGDGNY